VELEGILGTLFLVHQLGKRKREIELTRCIGLDLEGDTAQLERVDHEVTTEERPERDADLELGNLEQMRHPPAWKIVDPNVRSLEMRGRHHGQLQLSDGHTEAQHLGEVLFDERPQSAERNVAHDHVREQRAAHQDQQCERESDPSPQAPLPEVEEAPSVPSQRKPGSPPLPRRRDRPCALREDSSSLASDSGCSTPSLARGSPRNRRKRPCT
jgi:hypothetical protein